MPTSDNSEEISDQAPVIELVGKFHWEELKDLAQIATDKEEA